MGFRVKGGFATDKGNSKEINQDDIIIRCFRQNGELFLLGAVCDGIGGLEKGEVASRIVVNGINAWFDDITQRIDVINENIEVIISLLNSAVQQWNYAVKRYNDENGVRSGTTMSLIMIKKNDFYIVHVGDSRIYRCNLYLEQLTNDEVVVKNENGEAKYYLSNYMGRDYDLLYHSLVGTIEHGDKFLFCSDGFYHSFSNEDMGRYIARYQCGNSIYEICRDAIFDMMGRQEMDNISVGMLFFE